MLIILHSTQQNSNFQPYYQSFRYYFLKIGRMDEEQAAFEQLTFNDFKKWSFTALKTFNIYPILMQHMNIMSLVLLSLLLIFE